MSKQNHRSILIFFLCVIFLVAIASVIYIKQNTQKNYIRENSLYGAQIINENNRKLIGTQIESHVSTSVRKNSDNFYISTTNLNSWDSITRSGIVSAPASADMLAPATIAEFIVINGKTPELLLKNGDCAVFSTKEGTGWNCKAGMSLSYSFKKYPIESSLTLQSMVVGYICDGILYDGTLFSNLSDTYKINILKDGNYQFYVISNTSDYLALKEGQIILAM